MSRGPLTLCALAGAILLVGGAEVWSPWIVAAGAVGLVLAVVRPRAELSMLVPPCVIALACLAPWRLGVGAAVAVAVAAGWSAGLARRRGGSEGHARPLMVPLMRVVLVACVLSAVVVGQVQIERTVSTEPGPGRTTDIEVEYSPSPYNRVGERTSTQPFTPDPPSPNQSSVSERLVEFSYPTSRISQESAILVMSAETEFSGSGRLGATGAVDARESGFAPAPWFLVLALFAVAIVFLRLIGRLPSIPGASTRGESGGDVAVSDAENDEVVAWYDDLVATRGHRRARNEPILSHGRRIALETNDDRYRQLARVVSGHAYSGTPITRELTELFGEIDND